MSTVTPQDRIHHTIQQAAQEQRVGQGTTQSPPKDLPPEKGQEKVPTRTQQAIQTLSNDATDAAWRTATNQFVKLVQEPAAGLMARHLSPDDEESMRRRISEFMKSEAGVALVSGLLSVAVAAMPVTDPRAQRLARELRVKAMTDMGGLIAEVLTGPLRQVMSTYLQGLPELPPDPAQLPAAPPAGIDYAFQGHKTTVE